MLSPYDVQNIDSIMSGEGDWFTAQLLRIIGKADDFHKDRLRLGFPAEVALWEKWYYKRPEYEANFIEAFMEELPGE